MSKRKRRQVSINTIKGLDPTPCPNCGAVLRGATGVNFEPARGPLTLTGNFTMCGECCALLVFSDERGHLRVMTEAERDDFPARLHLSPDVAQLLDLMMAEAKRKRGAWFTRTPRN